LRNLRRSWSCLLSWLIRQLANTNANSWMGWSPSAGQPGNRQSPAPPSSTYTDRLTAPRTTKDSPLSMPMPTLPSGQRHFRLLSAPSTLRVNTSNHPQRFKTVFPAWPTQPPCTRVEGSTRVSEGCCSIRCFYHPARWRRVMVDSRQHKSELPLLVRIFQEGRREKNVV
jgi:hypothetical protein